MARKYTVKTGSNPQAKSKGPSANAQARSRKAKVNPQLSARMGGNPSMSANMGPIGDYIGPDVGMGQQVEMMEQQVNSLRSNAASRVKPPVDPKIPANMNMQDHADFMEKYGVPAHQKAFPQMHAETSAKKRVAKVKKK